MRTRSGLVAAVLMALVVSLAPSSAGAVAVQVAPPSLAAAEAATTVAVAAVSPLTPGSKPTISGERRYRKKLTANPGTWKASGLTFRYRWFRDGRPIKGKGSTKRTRVMTHDEVGKKMSVRVTAYRAGNRKTMGPVSDRTAVVRHLHDPRRTVTYSVVNDGSRLDMALTRKRLAAIYEDARGWRRGAVKFKQVKSGGHFTVVMAKASRVPRYSSACSTKWSCRVGRNVIINEARWRTSTRAWRAAGKSITSYRHMVVNHETGHWFGKGHVGCVGRGRAAPIMQQQSKGLQGCKPNPWPRTTEAASIRR
ncbi:DUF3152 domain-containing protein [Aeromicrobium sp. CF4.19]|uniref:DUF3152 domain-containing protein n=1 Tax=Aeromicrobium sp. CF4.19 TaxID=3373082 RepID=UPI003EE6BE7D